MNCQHTQEYARIEVFSDWRRVLLKVASIVIEGSLVSEAL